MNTLNDELLGKKIKAMRETAGMTQQALSDCSGLSRNAIGQIEAGKRTVSAIELSVLCNIFDVSLTQIMNAEENATEIMTVKERVSEADLDVVKFKNLVLYILSKCGAKPNVGKTVLYKLLYFSEFNYYEIYEELMTGAKYSKLPNGPVPKCAQPLMDLMEKDGDLQKITSFYYGKAQEKYIPLKDADLSLFSAAEIQVVDNVINTLSDYNANTISEYSHKDIPWEATEDNEVIDYELVFYRKAPYSVRNYEE